MLTGDGVPGAVSQLAYAACPASVTHVSHGTHVMAAACFLLLESSFLQVLLLVVDLDALVAGDLRHELPDLPKAFRYWGLLFAVLAFALRQLILLRQ